MAHIEGSIEYVLNNEGGSKYTNTPGDNGGPTKYGITLSTLALFRHQAVTSEDVKNLKLEEACRIYKQNFWDLCGLDFYQDQACATVVFDCAVNRGVGTANKYVVRTCASLQQINVNKCDPKAFVTVFEKIVEEGYLAIVASNPGQRKFLKGWLNRARRLLTLIKGKASNLLKSAS